MSDSILHYKGYSSRPVTIDVEQELFHGQVDGIKDVVTFEGKTPAEYVTAFHESVDDYIAFCESRGEVPEKPFSGRFMLRISSDLHQQAAHVARASNQSLNAWIKSLIEQAVTPDIYHPISQVGMKRPVIKVKLHGDPMCKIPWIDTGHLDWCSYFEPPPEYMSRLPTGSHYTPVTKEQVGLATLSGIENVRARFKWSD